MGGVRRPGERGSRRPQADQSRRSAGREYEKPPEGPQHKHRSDVCNTGDFQANILSILDAA